jgi:hypothetical protein
MSVRLEVLTVVRMMMIIFWVVTLHRLTVRYQLFGETVISI